MGGMDKGGLGMGSQSSGSAARSVTDVPEAQAMATLNDSSWHAV